MMFNSFENEEVTPSIEYVESIGMGVNKPDLIIYKDKNNHEDIYFMLSNIKRIIGTKKTTNIMGSAIRREFLMDGESNVDGMFKAVKSFYDPTITNSFNAPTFFVTIDLLEWLLLEYLHEEDLWDQIENMVV